MPTRRAFLLLFAAIGPTHAEETAPAPEPNDYRRSDYKAATPATLKGATVLTVAAAKALWAAKAAVFVDVFPRAPKPANLPPDTVWRERPRDDIPGSLWLADTGYGDLAEPVATYFADGLAEATGGDRDHPLVFYCLPSCWHSWNAARRALSLGYTHVNWLPGGTDAWTAAGLPLERREPAPRPGT